MKNIGVLGGTFDPPHEAHLKIAERSLNQFKLDKIIFIPSGNPWQKKDSTPYSHRFEMTKILIKNSDSFAISDLESSEQNPSYTYETLEKLQHPKENLYFILGSDTAMNIKTWKNYDQLSNLTQFLIALRREDSSETLSKNFPFDYKLIEGEKLDLSSTGLREKLEENKMNNIGLPPEIFNYINENKIYGIFLLSSSTSDSNSLSFPKTLSSNSSIFSISDSNSSSFSKTSSFVCLST